MHVSPCQLPARSLYEYCFDVTDGCWRSWRSYVKDYVPPADGQFSKILVPTADVVRWVVRMYANYQLLAAVPPVHGAGRMAQYLH